MANSIVGFQARLMLYWLRFFAVLSLKIHRPTVIGITGSVGKSSTRNAVYGMLKNYHKVLVIKEGNSETGVPLGILGVDPGNYGIFDWLRAALLSPFGINNIRGFKYLIVEMGIDSPHPPKNMDYLLTIVRPDISIVLNVHPVHTMQFDDLYREVKNNRKRLGLILDRIAEEKMKIITKAKPAVAVYNSDSTRINSIATSFDSRKTVMKPFGNNGKAEVGYAGYDVDLGRSVFKFLVADEKDIIRLEIKDYVLPEGYLEVFGAAICVGKSIGLTAAEIVSGISKNFTMPPGRGSVFSGISSSVIIDSTYNSSKASLLTYLEMAKSISRSKKRPLVLLLGDMRELGREAKSEHEEVAEKVAALEADKIFLVGPNMKQSVLPHLASIKRNRAEIRWFSDSLAAGAYAKKVLPYRSVVLAKGSQNEIFLEEAVKKIIMDKADRKMLCRQNDFWLNRKKIFFESRKAITPEE